MRCSLVGSSRSGIGLGNERIVSNVPGARIVQRANILSAIISSVRAEMGAAILPSLIGDDLEAFVRLTPPIEELSTACWLDTIDNARHQPHIRAVIGCVVAQIERTAHRAQQLMQSARARATNPSDRKCAALAPTSWAHCSDSRGCGIKRTGQPCPSYVH